ncbi:MAG TPA: crossover junction endodeoxyribonuclease RuvC [Cytophagales bacterium]|nr:crossover junction endodeoxyribonuclease RuvC [Cytophagales bacterium]
MNNLHDNKGKSDSEKIILGIDPGTNVMGYGVIMVQMSKINLIQYGVIKLDKYEDHFVRLKKIYERVSQLIEEFMPEEMAVEAPFYGQNVQSMLKLGRAQGVTIAAAMSKQIPIVEYAPKKIKQSVTGNGNASKEQVAAMLKNLLKFKDTPEFLDATDALAAAVCHHYQNGTLSTGKSKSWSSFLKENPDRLK